MVYTTGRVCGIATRPLLLIAANNYLAPLAAESLAVAFLASTLALVVAAAGPHRRFYARYFAEKPAVNGLSFYLYTESVFLLIALGCVVVFLIGFYSTGSLPVAIASGIYFASEKLADELLRLRLFERNFNGWGRANIQRTFLQFGGLATLLVLPPEAMDPWHLVVALAIGNFAVFIPQLPTNLIFRVWRQGLRLHGWLIGRAIRTLLADWLLWTIAVVGTLVGYLDRVLALAIDKVNLPLFTLVVMCFSILQMAVDFYYVSRNRREFLEQKISIFSALLSRTFVVSICAGLALSVVVCVIALFVSRGGPEFPLGYIAAIAGLQITVAIASVPREILYWSSLLNWLLRIEIGFWILFSFVLVWAWALGFSTMVFFGLAVVCALVRLLVYVYISSWAVPAAGRITKSAGARGQR